MRAFFVIDNQNGTIHTETEESWNTPENKPNQLAKFDMDTDTLPTIPEGVELLAWNGSEIVEAGASVLAALAAAQNLTETTRQEAKSDSLKAVENNFLALCDSLTSTTSHTKLTFAQIAAIGDAMTDQALHISIAIQLLSIDAEGKTVGGLLWWFDCAWHEDIIEVVE